MSEYEVDLKSVIDPKKAFHWKDGVYFQRLSDGGILCYEYWVGVKETKPKLILSDIVIPPLEWISIMDAVSIKSSDAEQFGRYKELHLGVVSPYTLKIQSRLSKIRKIMESTKKAMNKIVNTNFDVLEYQLQDIERELGIAVPEQKVEEKPKVEESIKTEETKKESK